MANIGAIESLLSGNLDLNKEIERDKRERKSKQVTKKAAPKKKILVKKKVPSSAKVKVVSEKSNLSSTAIKANLPTSDQQIVELPTDKVRPSKFANRSELSLQDANFVDLMERIKNHKQETPIKVRPSGDSYEIVYGHSRHRACQLLGIPVKAIVEAVTDKELVLLMFEENYARRDLSPFEEGLMYQHWLDQGVFDSQVEISKATGQAKGAISKRVSMTKLPVEIIEFIGDTRELKIKPSNDLLQKIGDKAMLTAVLDTIESYAHTNHTIEQKVSALLRTKTKKKAASKTLMAELKDINKVTYAACRIEKGAPIIRFRKALTKTRFVKSLRKSQEF